MVMGRNDSDFYYIHHICINSLVPSVFIWGDHFQASYTLEGTVLENVESIKYLGVTITSDMKWNTHIRNVCSKANRTLGFLRRNLFSCPQDVKEGCDPLPVPYRTVPYQVKYSTISPEAYRNIPKSADNLRTYVGFSTKRITQTL